MDYYENNQFCTHDKDCYEEELYSKTDQRNSNDESFRTEIIDLLPKIEQEELNINNDGFGLFDALLIFWLMDAIDFNGASTNTQIDNTEQDMDEEK